ncbi:DUF2190 family protein [Paraburkholderia sp. J11-2]|uniref:DUF2190 family protein n=1 Tax=Paraburkholderia sp. J11-2 TaxID=2805431 RepID=UPI002AB6C457|nr:DUF2190 family protein [Paraburkholderia sp. J11-2]
MQNFVQKGDTLTFTNSKAVASGQLVLIGSLPCVACANYPAGIEGEYRTEGVYDVTAVAADIASAGDRAYFNGTAVSATGTTAIGIFVLDKAKTATTARVRLDGVSVAPAA